MSIGNDARHGIRMLARNPGFTAVVVLALALGIGATTAIFSVVNGVLLAPLQYRDAGRIVSVGTKSKGRATPSPRITGGDLMDVRDQSGVFDSFGYYFGGEVGLQMSGHGEFTGVFWVQPGLFSVFGEAPVVGRWLEDGDSERSAMVGLPFAMRNFGSAAGALGKTIHVENQAYEIAGVMPADFQFPDKAEVWLAQPRQPGNLNRTAYNYYCVARVKTGLGLQAAQAGLDTLAARLAAAYPASNEGKSFVAIPLRDRMVGGVRSTLYLLLGAVALVLLIACANVANLLLARTPGRAREMAVRSALGANRWRIVRQLSVENLLMSFAAAVVGIGMAQVGIATLLRIAPENLPRLGEIRMSGTVLAFAIGASLVSSLFFGLAPAWQAARIELADALKQGGTRGVVGRGSHGMRSGLVIAEIALSFVLATGAGLLFRSFVALTNVEFGFRTSGILVAYAHAPAHSMEEYLQVGRLIEDALGRVRKIPGVSAAAAVMGLPNGRYGSNGSYAVEGMHKFEPGQKLPHAGFELTSPGYFAAMGIPLLQGRDFTAQDVYDAPFAAIVSAALVHEVFPKGDAIGRRIQLGLDSTNWCTIAGVVGDVRPDPGTAPGPEIYMPLRQHPYHGNEVQIVVNASVPPGSLSNDIRREVRGLLPETAMKFTTMEAMVSDSVATPRFRTALVGVFAALALLLAMAGVYGVMTQLTAERTAEMGVRLALGASPGDVMRLILARASVLAAVGLAVGVVASMLMSGVIRSMLFGLQSTDSTTYAAVLAGVGLTTIAAAAVPAWRAGRINPVEAMRQE